MAGTQSGGERGLIHDSAARNVEDDRSGFRGLELGNAHEPPGLRCQRRVDGDDVRSMEELRKPDQACTHFGRLLLGQVRIVREHPHLEANCATGDGFADLPEADDPERLAPQLGAGEAGTVPLAGLDRRVGAREVAEEGEEEGDRVLRSRERVAGGRVDDQHPGTDGGVDVDPVDPHARDADHAEARRGRIEEFGVDPSLRPDHKGIPSATFAEHVQKLAAGPTEPNVGVVCDREMVDGRLRYRLDDEDPGHGRSLAAARMGLALWLTNGANRRTVHRSRLPRDPGWRIRIPTMIRRHLMTLRVGLMLADYVLAVAVFWLVAAVRFGDGASWRAAGIDQTLGAFVFAGLWVTVMWASGPLPAQRALARLDRGPRPGARDPRRAGDHPVGPLHRQADRCLAPLPRAAVHRAADGDARRPPPPSKGVRGAAKPRR